MEIFKKEASKVWGRGLADFGIRIADCGFLNTKNNTNSDCKINKYFHILMKIFG
jgi:hypothetical protein